MIILNHVRITSLGLEDVFGACVKVHRLPSGWCNSSLACGHSQGDVCLHWKTVVERILKELISIKSLHLPQDDLVLIVNADLFVENLVHRLLPFDI